MVLNSGLLFADVHLRLALPGVLRQVLTRETADLATLRTMGRLGQTYVSAICVPTLHLFEQRDLR